ncbi:TPR repeat family protein [Oceanicola granulosus HTCC2516]|uniref:FAD assembly factor SdhE n=1 Tax=Oceanicola granulosus (strain ATCC BAA-861 / DSM 15982 / KCTC 12143 / HTCC2516) TaxID=314256 RepID=Q2C9T4_OCEGH|nr:succinate dehydrogenase assembly factor 2 [Oceanicola granulosus]EAR49437.1 TPR repeat family protein [Oceanicola granulosus HTCC2516]
MSERHETRLKRLRMRSMRRGMKEMDLLLMAFADARLAGLSGSELDAYERLLEESDQDLYAWISGAAPVPAAHAPLIARIAETAPGRR